MDPDEHLIEELAEELRRSLGPMHLQPEFRQGLKERLLATPTPWWRRWASLGPDSGWGRGALAGVAVAAVAVAVAVPLAISQHAPPQRSPQFLVMIPPGTSAGESHSAVAAPASCLGGELRLTVTPAQATLAPGQTARFAVSESGGNCSPETTVRGPSAAGLSVELVPAPLGSVPAGSSQASYLITWTGRTVVVRHGSKLLAPGSAGQGAQLSPGTYVITVEVPHSSARASIDVTIRK